MLFFPQIAPFERRVCFRMAAVGFFALALLVCAVLLLVAAEWPRIVGRLGEASERRGARARSRRKERFTVIEGEGDGADEFAASVERDLANLPVIGEHDDRSRR